MCTDKSPKAFVLSAGIQKLTITWLSVDNFNDRVLCYKPTSINHNIHGCCLCRYRATGCFWWISGLRAVAMWSSSSFTKTDPGKHHPCHATTIPLSTESTDTESNPETSLSDCTHCVVLYAEIKVLYSVSQWWNILWTIPHIDVR